MTAYGFLWTVLIFAPIISATVIILVARKSRSGGYTTSNSRLQGALSDTTFETKKAQPGTTQIAYKRAYLLGPGQHNDRYFQGVSGFKGYKPVDETDKHDHGFHAYKDFKRAKHHVQEGNVLLEVLLSGDISEHSLGYTSTKQRVLQIIADDCIECATESTHFVYEAALNRIVFTCKKHRKIAEGILNQQSGRDTSIHEFDQLSTVLPWIAEHRIVVSKRSGDNQFVPTKIAS